jgi:transcriptional regulator with XRE-family HTH domain
MIMMNTHVVAPYELYRGLLSRIARQLGLSRSYVSRVAHGERTSAAVEAALRKELARIQAPRRARASHPATSARKRH